MPEVRDLDPAECTRLLRAHGGGRAAVSTPDGPQIVPVVYRYLDGTLVLRTTSYGVLGSYAPNSMLALEIGEIDLTAGHAWSVVARGRSWVEDDPEELGRIRAAWGPRTITPGTGNVYLRFRVADVTGSSIRRVPTREAAAGSPHAFTAS
jgi:nitroimidazol reductase NimA-like FMN-containing flavoprotein (pyridoxamine 5'-phosphate oxidase superfamily)